MRRWTKLGWLILLLGLASGACLWWHLAGNPNHLLRRGREALGQGDWNRAARYASELETRGHPDAAHLLWGELLFYRGAYAEALGHLNRIKDQGEFRLSAARLSGKCLLYLQSPREAERVFRFVLDQMPDDVEAHRGLAAVYYDQGAWDRAISHLEAVARLDPDDARPCRLLGLIYKDLDDPTRAAEWYDRAWRQKPSPKVAAEIVAEWAACLIKQHRFVEGQRVLDDCPSPEPPDLAALRAECLAGHGKMQEARDLLETVLQQTPTRAASLRLLGKLELEGGHTARAVELLRKADEIDPLDYSGLYLLALALEKSGRSADASAVWRRVHRLKDDLDELTRLNREALADPWKEGPREKLAALCARLDKPALAGMWRRAADACRQANQLANRRSSGVQ